MIATTPWKESLMTEVADKFMTAMFTKVKMDEWNDGIQRIKLHDSKANSPNVSQFWEMAQTQCLQTNVL